MIRLGVLIRDSGDLRAGACCSTSSEIRRSSPAGSWSSPDIIDRSATVLLSGASNFGRACDWSAWNFTQHSSHFRPTNLTPALQSALCEPDGAIHMPATAQLPVVSSPPSPGTSSSCGGLKRGPSSLASSGRSPGAPCPSYTGSLTPAIAPPLKLAFPSRLCPCISSGLIGSSAAGDVLSTHFDFQPGRASGMSSGFLLVGFRPSFKSLFVIRHSLRDANGESSGCSERIPFQEAYAMPTPAIISLPRRAVRLSTESSQRRGPHLVPGSAAAVAR